MADETTTALVKPSEPQPQTVSIHSAEAAGSLLGSTSAVEWISLTATDPRLDSVLFRCQFAPDGKLSDLVGSTIGIVHVWAKQVEIQNDLTGEIDNCVANAVLTDDGKVLTAVSIGVKKSLASLMLRHGHPTTWTSPKYVTIRQVGPALKRMLVLEPAQPPVKAKAK